jgi:3-phosphoshikimate 1-carboxyvinyltransferase
MNFEIPTGVLKGDVQAPPSKSITHRLLIIGALSGKEFLIRKPLFCEDTQITMDGLKTLGFEFVTTKEAVRFSGNRRDVKKAVEIYVGNSGTSARFLTAVAALLPVRCIIIGSSRMRQRPMLTLLDALINLGAKIENRSGYLPLKIFGGGLTGGEIRVDSSQSSQFLSALLLIAPYLSMDSHIYFGDSVASKPYAVMTVSLMGRFGISIEEGASQYRVACGQRYSNKGTGVEGDFTNAANFMVGAAISKGRVEISNLSNDSIQGDKIILKILRRCGAQIEVSDSEIIVEGKDIRAIDCDMQYYPDLVPIVTVLALFAKGASSLRNVAHLRLKESDRLQTIVDNVRRMGGKAYLHHNNLVIDPRPLRGTPLSAFNDHRIAMSFAMTGLRVPGVTIEEPECVKKSYPHFWSDLKRLVK